MNSTDTQPLLQLSGVGQSYSSGHLSEQVLKGISLQLEPGDSLALVGPSGCGKSTLLRLIAGLELPDLGTLSFAGKPHTKVNRGIALVLQDYGLLPWKTVIENIMLGLQFRREDNARQRSQELLDTLGISAKTKAFPGQLSGGQRQRVALARALILKPRLLLLDEPFAALDSITRESLQDLLAEMWLDHKFAMITVTHNLQEAAFLGSRIAVLSATPGRITATVSNPGACSTDYRDTNEFATTVTELRRIAKSATVEQGAVH